MRNRTSKFVLLSVVLFWGGTESQAASRGRINVATRLKDSLSTGQHFTCQSMGDGSVRCWGQNQNGQLGDGTTTDRSSPATVVGLGTATTVRAGGSHACALLSTGIVRCWGGNGDGQIGDGSATNRLTAVNVSGLNLVSAIATGGNHTCALLASGAVACWGTNFKGQVGDGSNQTRFAPVAVTGINNAIAITAGASHTCALLADGTAQCWGNNEQGQLGNGGGANSNTPVAVSGLTNAVAIEGGSIHTCALLADGTAKCWGDNSYGQLGTGSTIPSNTPVVVAGLANAVAISTGGLHTCAVTIDGFGRCWGYNIAGQLGDGTQQEHHFASSIVSGIANVVVISAALYHSCAVLSDGTAQCWGENALGQLGNGTTTNSFVPVKVTGGGSISAALVAAGLGLPPRTAGTAVPEHTCAVRNNSGAACWGANDSGQIGDGSTTNRTTPVAVSLTNLISIAPGAAHTCGLFPFGRVKCWGAGGRLGDGTSNSSPTPVFVSNLTTAIAISAGPGHTCAVLVDGTVQCWGDNGLGQLGDGTTDSKTSPVPVPRLSNVVAIAAGSSHTCALLANGSMQCWGTGAAGQLGNGAITTKQLTPVAVTGIGQARTITAGGDHSCAILAANGVGFCWGANTYGELGDGSTTNRSKPVPAAGASTLSISAGTNHTCVLSPIGGVQCWGRNTDGQLGDGTKTDRLNPVFARSTQGQLSNLMQVSAGDHHTCALQSNGAPFCWGGNKFGEIGDGSSTDQPFAVAVPSFTLNINPNVSLGAAGRLVTINIIATCEAGASLHVNVTLSQGAVSGFGAGQGECTGVLQSYPVTVPAHGADGFVAGPARAEAEATIRAHGAVVDTQQWTRQVSIVAAQ